MPKLSSDILREVFYEIVKGNGSFKNVDKFMMIGREPFELVLDICREAQNVVFLKDKIVAKLPNIDYIRYDSDDNDTDESDSIGNDSELYNGTLSDIDNYHYNSDSDSDSDSDDEDYIFGTVIPHKFFFIKPISVALASVITSLNLKSFIPAFIPMLKAINKELKEVNIQDVDKQLSVIFEACVNIPNVVDGVTIQLCSNYNFSKQIKAFAIPSRKLTIKNAYFNYFYHGKKFEK
uniref:Uncharacterized protein n=1 Tax=Panagrolaimus superbus TaxID=310955 RepID=A0A914XWD3_9BILA